MGMQGKLQEARRAYLRVPVVSEKRFLAGLRLLEVVAAHLAEHANRSLIAARQDDPAPVMQAKALIDTRAGERLPLSLLAQHVHLSPYYLSKMFKTATGMTLTEYIARVRIEKAKRLLGNRHMRITEIASDAGFQSISQFNRTFRRYTGSSPTAYRTTLCA
jgi:AraC-like DNA-binding protein